MRIPRVFVDQELTEGQILSLEGKTCNYLVNALRLKEGQVLTVFNGSGFEYSATLQSASKRSAKIAVAQATLANRESPLQTHMAIGVSRGERMDWALQKANELGVSEITPIFSERCEVKLKGERLQKKMEHWRQTLISSCEQCQRNTLPKLNQAINLDEFLTKPNSDLKLVLHHRSSTTLKEFDKPENVTLLIGPEGGLNEDEIALAHKSGYTNLTLGPRVLRTETAPVVALSAAQLLWGDLGI